MSSILIDRRFPCGGKPVPDKSAKKAPRLVLGLGASPLATAAAVAFRADGWEVAIVTGGEDARRLAVRGRAHVLVLAAGGNLLETAKLVTALPKRTKVVLVGPDAELATASGYLGAAFVVEAGGVAALADAVRTVGPCS